MAYENKQYQSNNNSSSTSQYDDLLDVDDDSPLNESELKFSTIAYHIEMRILNCLTNPVLDVGLVQLQLLVRHFEAICRANRKLPKDYDSRVDELKKKLATQKLSDSQRGAMEAQEKLDMILMNLFSTGTIEMDLRNYDIAPPMYKRVIKSEDEGDVTIDPVVFGVSELDYVRSLKKVGKLDKFIKILAEEENLKNNPS